MKKTLLFLVLALVLLGWSNFSFAQTAANCDPTSPAYDAVLCYRYQTGATNVSEARDLYEILEAIGGFLLVAAGVIAGVVIIVSGLMWMSAGSNSQRVATAKGIFKNGIIGAIIIFAAGTIIQTIVVLATDPLGFF